MRPPDPNRIIIRRSKPRYPRVKLSDTYGRVFDKGPPEYRVVPAHIYTGNSTDGWRIDVERWRIVATRWFRRHLRGRDPEYDSADFGTATAHFLSQEDAQDYLRENPSPEIILGAGGL